VALPPCEVLEEFPELLLLALPPWEELDEVPTLLAELLFVEELLALPPLPP
jgi:hypothetical protein